MFVIMHERTLNKCETKHGGLICDLVGYWKFYCENQT